MKFIAIVLISAFLISCKKDTTDSTNIFDYDWSMLSFSDGKRKIITNKDHQYKLEFINDSSFEMNSSVNLAKGGFVILSKGNIKIQYYHSITEVGGENIIDARLFALFPLMKSYKVLGNYLYFENNENYIKFRRN